MSLPRGVPLFAVFLVTLTGCAAPAAVERPAPALDVEAVGWAPLVLSSVDEVPVPAPPAAGSEEAVADAAAFAALTAVALPDRWDVATEPWTDLQLRLIAATKQNPPRASRALALAHVAMYDAALAADAARATYDHAGPKGDVTYPSETAAVSAAAAGVLTAMYPGNATEIAALADEGVHARALAGLEWTSDATAGDALGKAVAERVLAQAATDGSADLPDISKPEGDCLWEPTPPALVETPLEVGWGTVDPWFLANGSAVRPPPPAACGSDELEEQMMEVYRVVQDADARQKAIAAYWADGPGTAGPPGHWNRIALDLVDRHDLTTLQAARVFAYMDAAVMDAGIVAWDAKYAYWSVRPVTWIQEHVDPAFATQIATPPFPGYLSGHSTFSCAAATVLMHFFPEEQVHLRALATEAANSRLYAGIHTRGDDEIGARVGMQVGEAAVAKAMADGGWTTPFERAAARALVTPPK